MSAQPPKRVNLNLTYSPATGQLIHQMNTYTAGDYHSAWDAARDAAAATIQPTIEEIIAKFTALAAQPQPRAITQRKDQP